VVDGLENSELEIGRYIKLVLKKKHLFAVSAVLVITAFVVAGYVLPKKYRAECTVFIERNVINSLIEGIAVTPSMDERLRVIAYSLKSRGLLMGVLEEIGVDVKSKDHSEVEQIVMGFQKNTGIDIKGDRRRQMDLFSVSFTGRDPALARDYVNTLVRRYIEQNLSAKREEAYGANRFLSEQIDFFKDKLDIIESDIVDFRRDRGIFVATDERVVVEEIKKAQEKIDELGIDGMELRARKKLVEKQLKKENPYTVTVFGRNSNSIEGRIVMLQNRLNELLSSYTENYPEVIMVRAEIESLKKMLENRPQGGDGSQDSESAMSTLNPLYQQLKEEFSRIELELAALRAREDNLKKLIEAKKEYLRSIPVEKKKLTDIERERDTTREIYEQLVLRHGQSEVSKQMEVQDKTTTFRIADPAVLPTRPVSPNRVKIILMGILAGLAGGFGIVMFSDFMDSSVKTVDALKGLGVPVLAMIPSIQNQEEQERKRKRDVLLYSLSGLYMLGVIGVLAMEFFV
jgi:polysaccharide chain length determinant protein (PEP-CTERM system associated)